MTHTTRPAPPHTTAGMTPMRMTVLFVALFAALANTAFAQAAPPDFHGRVYLKTGELFTLRDRWTPPDMGKRVREKAAYIADSSMNKLPSIPVESAFAFETVNKIRRIAFSASCRIEAPGTYRFVREITYDQSDGTRISLTQYWALVVTSPVLVPKLDPFYFPHEPAYFSFASGHSDFERYSFAVYDQNNPASPVFSGKGPVVQLDSLTLRPDVIRFEEASHTYIVKGMYDGRQFMYKKGPADTAAPVLSEWTVTVRKPVFQMLQTWLPEQEFDDSTLAFQVGNSLKLQSIAYANLCEFRCVYFSKKTNTYVYTPMTIRDIKVESDKSFLESSETYSAVPDGFYNLIEIKRNETIALPPSGVEVRLTISFRTQYEQITRRYKAIVF